MKKLLTLVLALVMVFAVAAPAMALTSDTLGTIADAVTDYYELDVSLYQANLANFAADSIVTLPALQAANRGYITNEIVYFGVKLYQKAAVPASVTFADKAPAMMRITSTYDVTYATKTAYVVGSDGRAASLVYAAVPVYADAENTTTKNWEMTDLAFRANWLRAENTALSTALWAKGDSLYIFGSFQNGAKAFNVVVNMAPMFNLPVAAAAGAAYATMDTTGYRTARSAAAGATKFAVTDGTNTIVFEIDGVNRVRRMYWGGVADFAAGLGIAAGTRWLEYDEVWDTATNGYITYWNIANEKAAATQVSAIEGIFKAAKFDIALINTNALREQWLVDRVAGARLNDEIAGDYYTAVVTIPDVTVVEPPKTGDASTVAGFVMIAAAIVAALGLAYNKVRA